MDATIGAWMTGLPRASVIAPDDLALSRIPAPRGLSGGVLWRMRTAPVTSQPTGAFSLQGLATRRGFHGAVSQP
jgi:hypothetical protein